MPPHDGGASFRLDLGPVGSLNVGCGDQPLSDCVTAAGPLIEAISGRSPGGPASATGMVPLPPVAADDAIDVPLPPEAAPGDVPPLPGSLSGEAPAEGGPPIETLDDGPPAGPNVETPVIDGLEGGAEPGPAN